MSIYGGIQMPKIDEYKLDDKKERKQILNYLALLDEKLRYMFQNIDIEENLSADSQKMFFKYGEDIQNLIKDTEGNFSLFEQTINGISSAVQDVNGNVSLLQQTAESLSSSIASAEGKLSTLEQTAERIETNVSELDDELGTVSSTATQTAKQIGWIVKSGTSASSMTLTDKFLEIVSDNITIKADVDLYGEMTVYTSSSLSSVGGSLGYGSVDDLFNASTRGIFIKSKSEDCYVGATNSGCHMIAGGYGAMLYEYDGNFMPYEDGDQMMGDPDYRWQGVYAKNGTIQTSDRRMKKDIRYNMEKYEEFFANLKPTQYKMIDGESDRFHIGFISQDVEKNLEEQGLTSLDFAGFIKTPKRAVRNDEESEIVDYHYSLRYDEFVALNTHMIQKLMARVTELENKLEALS